MAYVINKSDGTAFTTLQDSTIDTTSSLTLVGRNYIGYGEIQNENFLFLLENFANTTAPTRPVSGQLWFDTTDNVLKVYDGTKWVEVGSAAISPTAPENPPAGAFWFKSTANTLYTWNGSSWVFIGPETAEGYGVTRARSTTILGDTGTEYPVILITVSDIVIAIVSSSSFTINSSNPIAGFNNLQSGITLSSSHNLNGNLNGNASTATALDNIRLINGVGFNGTQNITINASTTNSLQAGDFIVGNDFNGSATTVWSVEATSNNTIGKIVARDSGGDFSAGTITADLEGNVTGNVTASSGTSRFDVVEANRFIGQTLTGNAFSATKLRTARDINGVSFDGQSDITVPASARTLTDTALAANVVSSQLESVGVLTGLTVNGTITVSNNHTIAAGGSGSTTTANRLMRLVADDGTDTSVVDLIAPDVSVAEGYGSKGALMPSVDQDLDLGKSAKKFDNVYANTFNGALVGNASTATTATTATNIAGGAAGSIAYQTASGATSLLPIGAVNQVLKSTGSAVQWGAPSLAEIIPGNYITGNNYDGLSTKTWAVDADSANTASKVVVRDSSGNFAAGTITANLTGNVAGNSATASALQTARTINGVSFNGTGNITITATDPNAVPKAGGTMTGKLTLSANPTSALHAATKQYVDSNAGYTIVSGSSSTVGYTNQVGSFNNNSNYFDVYPPAGKTMSDLIAFIPSIRTIHYAGGVDGNDSIRCTYSILSNRIRVYVQNTEQRSKPAANYLGVWR
jgi:hypothetical protein